VPLQYTLRVLGYAHVIIIPTTIMEEVVLPAIRGQNCLPDNSRGSAGSGRDSVN
jgi:hypothetical protein